MNEEQLIGAARDLSPGTLLPFHWEFWRNHTGDIVRLVEIYLRERPPFELKIILVGDSVTLTKRESAPR
jgi:L-ascorbate metabolism protein UlaG (beta-lactamase superfamily)